VRLWRGDALHAGAAGQFTAPRNFPCHHPFCARARAGLFTEATMHSIIYLVGLIVVVLAILSFFGLR
jgi:hypothetical protein